MYRTDKCWLKLPEEAAHGAQIQKQRDRVIATVLCGVAKAASVEARNELGAG
jgi:hypothetical protein